MMFAGALIFLGAAAFIAVTLYVALGRVGRPCRLVFEEQGRDARRHEIEQDLIGKTARAITTRRIEPCRVPWCSDAAGTCDSRCPHLLEPTVMETFGSEEFIVHEESYLWTPEDVEEFEHAIDRLGTIRPGARRPPTRRSSAFQVPSYECITTTSRDPDHA